MAAGSIIIDLLMKTGAFETDTKRASKALEDFEKKAVDAGKKVGVALGAMAGVAVVAWQQLVDGAAAFKDLEEMTGSSGEELASFAIAAATAGTSVQDIAGMANRLTKSLSGVDDESKAAGAALTALGIPIKQFKGLDPAKQIDALAKAFNSFADGSSKTATAMALFGRQGAEMLKVFKVLGEEGRKPILTQEQIDRADAFADSIAKNAATIKAYGQAIATEALPPINQLLVAFTSMVTTEQAVAVASTAMRVSMTALITVFQTIAVVVSDVVFVFQGIGREIGAIFAQLTAPNLTQFRAISAAVTEDAERARTELDKFQARIMDIGSQSSLILAKIQSDPRELARRGRGPPTLPTLKFEGAVKDTKDKVSDVDRYIKKLQEQLQTEKQLTVEARLREDLIGELQGKATAAQEATLIGLAQRIDASKEATKQWEIEKKTIMALFEAESKLKQEGAAVYEATRTPLEQLNAEQDRLAKLLDAGAISWDTYGRAVFAASEAYDNTLKKNNEILSSTQAMTNILQSNFDSFFTNIQNGALKAKDAFKQMAQSILAQILRLIAQKAILSAFGFNIGGPAGGALGTVKAAHGAAFQHGRKLQAFASGGVINQPTLFPMAHGSGLAGEAGPEGVFPLRRSASGNLGVEGTQPIVNVQITNTAPGTTASARQNGNDVQVLIEQTKQSIMGDIRAGGNRMASTFERTYGVGRVAGAR